MTAPDLLVIGREGQLARSIAERAPALGLAAAFAGRPEVDLADPASVEAAVRGSTAPFILNAAAYTAVDQAESEPELAWAINAEAPGVMARAAAARGARLIQVSTDYVFDGRGGGAYTEEDAVSPLGAYGRSKLGGEEKVQEADAGHAVVRTAWVYSPFGKNFVKTMLNLAQTRPELRVVADQVGTPTAALDLADGLLAMVRAWRSVERAGGLFHLAGSGETSWAGLAARVFEVSRALGGPAAEVIPIPTRDYPTPAARPANSRLSSEKFARTFGYRAPLWEESVTGTVRRLLQGQRAP